jgi:hypothetical protein
MGKWVVLAATRTLRFPVDAEMRIKNLRVWIAWLLGVVFADE